MIDCIFVSVSFCHECFFICWFLVRKFFIFFENLWKKKWMVCHRGLLWLISFFSSVNLWTGICVFLKLYFVRTLKIIPASYRKMMLNFQSFLSGQKCFFLTFSRAEKIWTITFLFLEIILSIWEQNSLSF